MIVTRSIKRLHAANVVERFCHFLEHSGRSPVTVKNYRSDVEGLVRWFESKGKRAFHPGILSDTDLLRYRKWLDQQFKVTTIYRKLSTTKMFLSWAADARLVRRGELPRVPTIRAISPPRSQPRWLDRSEQERLQYAVNSGGLARDIAIVAIILNTGLRVSELCILHWEDVTISDSEGTLSVRRGRDDKQSQIPLNKHARKVLLSLKHPQQPEMGQVIFASKTGPMTRRGVEVIVKHYSKIAGLRKVTPRALRHTFCMNLATAGVSPYMVARLAGLGSTEMTRCYYEPFPLDLKQAVERLEKAEPSTDIVFQAASMPAAQLKLNCDVVKTLERHVKDIKANAAPQDHPKIRHYFQDKADSVKAAREQRPLLRDLTSLEKDAKRLVDGKQRRVSSRKRLPD